MALPTKAVLARRDTHLSLARRAAPSASLTRYDAMCRAIAEAHRVDDAKQFFNGAAALRECARRAGNLALQHQLAEIQLRAARRAGELLRDMRKRGEIGPGITKQDRMWSRTTFDLPSL